MKETLTFDEVLAYVGTTENEAEIRALFDACNARVCALRAIQTAKVAATLKKGDKVRTSGVRPKFLNDLTGEVVEIVRSGRTVYATVKIADGSPAAIRKYGRDGEVHGLPLTCLTIV